MTTDYLLDRTEEYNDYPFYRCGTEGNSRGTGAEDLRLWIDRAFGWLENDFEKRMLKRYAEKQKGKKK